MKIFIFLVCVVVSTRALKQELIDELIAKLQEFGLECSATEKASDADIEALMKRKPPVTHEGKCVIFCISKKMNIMKEDGSFGEGYVEWLNKAKADDPEFIVSLGKLYHTCQAKIETKEDQCQAAFEFYSCSLAEAKTFGLGDMHIF